MQSKPRHSSVFGILILLCVLIFGGTLLAGYLPGGVEEKMENGYTTPNIVGTTKEIMTPAGCKILQSNTTNMFFTPTKTLAEWNAFEANPPTNIQILPCVEVCSAGIFDGYTFPSGYNQQQVTKTKTIPNGSCSRNFQCNTTLDEWTPSSSPNCICTTGTWNGSACVELNQTKTMNCGGTPPTNAAITGPTSYTATTTDGGITWSPGILEYTPANIEKGVSIINNPTGKAGAQNIGNDANTANRYCLEAGFVDGLIVNTSSFNSPKNNSIAWWISPNWEWRRAKSNNSYISQLQCNWIRGVEDANYCEFSCNAGFTWSITKKNCVPVSKIFAPPQANNIGGSDTITSRSIRSYIRFCQEQGYDNGQILDGNGSYNSCGDNNVNFFNGSDWVMQNACGLDPHINQLLCTAGKKGYTWSAPYQFYPYGYDPFSASEGFAGNISISYIDPCATTQWSGDGEVCVPGTKIDTPTCNIPRCTDDNGNIVDDSLCVGKPKPGNGSCQCGTPSNPCPTPGDEHGE